MPPRMTEGVLSFHERTSSKLSMITTHHARNSFFTVKATETCGQIELKSFYQFPNGGGPQLKKSQ